jgi:hypothetical protein
MIIGEYGPATARDIATWFGLTGASQFPSAGMASRRIQGHDVWIAPKVQGRMTLRAMTKCLVCSKTVPVGRLRQHEKMHRPKAGT